MADFGLGANFAPSAGEACGKGKRVYDLARVRECVLLSRVCA
jgi:hypothetical protein